MLDRTSRFAAGTRTRPELGSLARCVLPHQPLPFIAAGHAPRALNLLSVLPCARLAKEPRCSPGTAVRGVLTLVCSPCVAERRHGQEPEQEGEAEGQEGPAGRQGQGGRRSQGSFPSAQPRRRRGLEAAGQGTRCLSTSAACLPHRQPRCGLSIPTLWRGLVTTGPQGRELMPAAAMCALTCLQAGDVRSRANNSLANTGDDVALQVRRCSMYVCVCVGVHGCHVAVSWRCGVESVGLCSRPDTSSPCCVQGSVKPTGPLTGSTLVLVSSPLHMPDLWLAGRPLTPVPQLFRSPSTSARSTRSLRGSRLWVWRRPPPVSSPPRARLGARQLSLS
jgi:hypothetical protein